MNISIRQLQAFLAVARTRNFSEAGVDLGLTQPALSLSIRRLEETLGARLFDRTTRSVELTPEGAQFLDLASNLATAWEDAFDRMRDIVGKRRGRVTVATLPSLARAVLPKAIASFMEAFPEIDVAVRDVLHDEAIDLIRNGRADMAISVAPAEGEDLLFRPCLHDDFVLVCRGDHPFAAKEEVTWAEVAAEPLLAMEGTTSVRQHLDRVLAGAGVSARQMFEVRHLATLGGLVDAGVGITVIPSLCLPIVLLEGIVHRPLVAPRAQRTLGLIRRRRPSASVAAKAFEEVVLATVRRFDRGAREPDHASAATTFRKAGP